MTPASQIRTIRVEDDLWRAAMDRAQADGATLSEVMRGWLTDYAAGRRRVGPGRPGTVELSRSELARLRDLIDGLLGPAK